MLCSAFAALGFACGSAPLSFAASPALLQVTQTPPESHTRRTRIGAVPSRAPDSLPPQAFYDSLPRLVTSGGDIVYVLGVVTLRFDDSTTLAGRERAINAVEGQVVGGSSAGTYYVRLPQPWTARRTFAALSIVRSMRGVGSAASVVAKLDLSPMYSPPVDSVEEEPARGACVRPRADVPASAPRFRPPLLFYDSLPRVERAGDAALQLPGLLEVRFDAAASRRARQTAIDAVCGEVVGGTADETYLIRLPRPRTVERSVEAVRVVRTQPGVRFADVSLAPHDVPAGLYGTIDAAWCVKAPDASAPLFAAWMRYCLGVLPEQPEHRTIRGLHAVLFGDAVSSEDRAALIASLGARSLGNVCEWTVLRMPAAASAKDEAARRARLAAGPGIITGTAITLLDDDRPALCPLPASAMPRSEYRCVPQRTRALATPGGRVGVVTGRVTIPAPDAGTCRALLDSMPRLQFGASPDEIVYAGLVEVSFQPSTSLEQRQALLDSLGATVVGGWRGATYRLRLPFPWSEARLREALARLQRSPVVNSALAVYRSLPEEPSGALTIPPMQRDMEAPPLIRSWRPVKRSGSSRRD